MAIKPRIGSQPGRPAGTRRGHWVRRLAVTAAVVVVGGGALGAYWWNTWPIDTVGQVDFAQPLTVPPLAESRTDAQGRRVFDLTAQAGYTLRLQPGVRTPTWGFNRTYLGPTLRASVGETVRVNVHNALGEATTVHWHGMHLPARFDGGPHQPIQPRETWSPTWTIDQPAATLWYHPHPHGETEDHIYRGLAGMFILDDQRDSQAERLPFDYGVDDIPLIIQDKSFDGAALDHKTFGDTILVNGTLGPYLDVTTEAVRLRLLNASTARVYEFGFSDGRGFALVAGDGGLLPAPVQMQRLRLSPGERAEIVVQFQPGEQTVLRSYPPDLGVNAFSASFVGGRDRFDIMELRSADRLDAAPSVPARLGDPPDLDLDLDQVTSTRRFELQGGRRINGQSMDMNRIDETVTVDTTEIWEVENADGNYHNFHVHDVQFQVIDVDGKPPPAELGGWKDTVMVEPGQIIRLGLSFTDYTDPDSPYMFHCHLLHHEDRGMMGQFVVVEPGQAAGAPRSTHSP